MPFTINGAARAAATVGFCLASIAATPAAALTINDFVVNPIADQDPNDGVRTVVGGSAVSLDGFDTASDRFRFQLSEFGINDRLLFINTTANRLPSSGVNVIVLQDADDDANGNTVFNAGSAANLIAAQIEEAVAGFFVYFNSGLGINRLVFSNDLSSSTADLAILAAIQNPQDQVNVGPAAIALNAAVNQLPTFNNRNFAAFSEDVAAVPIPAPLAMLMAGIAGLGALRARRKT